MEADELKPKRKKKKVDSAQQPHAQPHAQQAKAPEQPPRAQQQQQQPPQTQDQQLGGAAEYEACIEEEQVEYPAAVYSDSGLPVQYVSDLRKLAEWFIPVCPGVVAVADCKRTDSGGYGGILPERYVHVYAFNLCFSDGTGVLCLCDCDAMQPTWDSLMGFDMEQHTREAACKGLHFCVHSLAAQELLKEPELWSGYEALAEGSMIDQVVPIVANPPDPYIITSDKKLLLSVGIDAQPQSGRYKQRAFISNDGQFYCCNTCAHERHVCAHVKALHTFATEVEERSVGSTVFERFTMRPPNHKEASAQRMPASAATTNQPAVTKTAVPLEFSNDAMKQRLDCQGGWFPPCASCAAQPSTECSHCVPEQPQSRTCPCGSHWADGNPVEQGWVACKAATLTSRDTTRHVDVFYIPCVAGKCKLEYDGIKDGLFNLSNHTLFTLCMLAYFRGMTIAPMSYYAYWQQLHAAHQPWGTDKLLPSRQVVRRALQCFLDLLLIDYDKWFDCPSCTQLQPHDMVFVGDGKVMGFRRDLALESTPSSSGRRVPDFELKQLSVLQHPKFKALLCRFAGVSAGKAKSCEPLSAAEFDSLIKHCRESEQAKGLGAVLGHIGHSNGRASFAWRSFLEHLCRDYPISGLLLAGAVQVGPHQPESLLLSVASRTPLAPGDRLELQALFPALARLVRQLKWQAVLPCVLDLLRDLESLARKPLTAGAEWDSSPADLSMADYESHEAYMPRYPLCRAVSQYAATSSKTDESWDRPPCTKYVRTHSGLTPGIFAVYCVHGVCLGFRLMTKGEGPSTAFNLLFHRLPTGPRVFIYDNACNLHRYAMRREPKFFARTWFAIDRTHQKGHSACHEGYKLDAYPSATVLADRTLGQINTQVAEQCNSALETVCSHMAYMRQEQFMKYAKFFLYRYNARKIAAMSQVQGT